MAKILQTQLPTALDQNVTSDTFNRAIRVLELNLNAVDVDQTPQFNQTTIDESKFRDGDIIWNTTLQKLQVYDQDSFKTISYTSRTLLATASVGTVQVITNGSITVEVG
jgi:hypothetical protein|tara:strand:+ start:451 stop:777 length:327 start_codon:yes stop_codon:yes gene_type:complete